jgi:hypothetical protein
MVRIQDNNITWVCTLFPRPQHLVASGRRRLIRWGKICAKGNKVHTQITLFMSPIFEQLAYKTNKNASYPETV